ncbi:amidohydrolase family protein [Parasphingorhabdus halotolerans]|uniref:Amidohydrolase family protein n=1 Tax=Parasphingorhabdus halotolerans TaxID=2725558 RepID=A0A6H2DMD4_9SPHN|nr:amidohydrolase family protein [Parasphingorhabdus halotolerans]QJB69348.1 amidohydrolase family protein [Parasphingorhabdus halotolerans]
MIFSRTLFGALLFVTLLLPLPMSAQAQIADEITYDIVIIGGRTMDPETGLDGIRNIGITDGTITAVTTDAIPGKQVITAQNFIVAPGFIDIHNHSPTPLGLSYQARDGVTTTLELEGGVYPVSAHGAYIRGKALINYGASTSHTQARFSALTGGKPAGATNILGAKRGNIGKDNGEAQTRFSPANPGERASIRAELETGLKNGGIGIGLLLDYISDAVDQDELHAIFELATEYETPVFVHIRRGIAGDPAGLDEVLKMAKSTGTKLHICHLSHNAMKNVGLFLDKIRAARANGVDVTTEVLPYNAGSTSIGAAVFGRDWRTIFDIDYKDVQLASTGEYFTRKSFEQTRREKPGAAIIHHYLKEEWTRALVKAPDVIIASDGLPIISTAQKVPPQGVGSFSKILGKYVRDEQALDMMTALSKMTLQPAQLLEKTAPVFRLKGRLQIGMDADITVFNPKTIRANTTYENPHQASTGVRYLLVGGEIVIEDGTIVPDVFPGQHLFATPRKAQQHTAD